MTNPWQVLQIQDELPFGRPVFPSKKAALAYARDWVAAEPGRAATLMSRQLARPTLQIESGEQGLVETKLHRYRHQPPAIGAEPHSDAERVDLALRDVSATCREATAFRRALVEVWKDALREGKAVATTVGLLLIVEAPPPRYRLSALKDTKQFVKLYSRRNRLRFKPDTAIFPFRAETITNRRFSQMKEQSLIPTKAPTPPPQEFNLIFNALRPR